MEIPTANGQARNGQAKRPRIEKGRYGLPQFSDSDDMPALDWIHRAFILYSGCHNLVNAFQYAGNIAFFLFALMGILTVELMLYSIYRYWKEGKLVGRMQTIGRWAGLLAMFFAVAGILAHAQAGTGNAWVAYFYQWVMPSSAPIMFFFAFLIQAVNPTMAAERDAIAFERLVDVEAKRGDLDQRLMMLDYQSDVRKMKKMVWKQKLVALWKEAQSRRTHNTLKHAMRLEMPKLLKELKVDVNDVGGYKRFRMPTPWRSLPPARATESEDTEKK